MIPEVNLINENISTFLLKGTNTAMCLTVVSLQTNPSQVFHGSASTVDDSHDKAALEALTKLAQSARDDDSVEETTPPVCHKSKRDLDLSKAKLFKPVHTLEFETKSCVVVQCHIKFSFSWSIFLFTASNYYIL